MKKIVLTIVSDLGEFSDEDKSKLEEMICNLIKFRQLISEL